MGQQAAQQYFLPAWAVWLQLAATIAIAVGAAVIAYRQWQTAQRELLLDLFDKRFKTLSNMLQAIYIEGNTFRTNLNDAELQDTVLKVGLLFGPDVYRQFSHLVNIVHKYTTATPAEQSALAERVKVQLPPFYNTCAKYMIMHEGYNRRQTASYRAFIKAQDEDNHPF